MRFPARVLFGLGAGAVLLLVIGAGLRPYLLPLPHSVDVVLSDVEIGFIQDMSAHHQQALFMVDRLDTNVDATVLRLAHQIESTQRTEVGMLQGWLRLINAPMANSTPMDWMHPTNAPEGHQHSQVRTSAVTAPATMPGMATWEDLDELGRIRGSGATTLFLQLMLRHHQGGAEMAEAFINQQHSGYVYEAAQAMLQDQRQEIGVMLMLLEELHALPLSYP